jgi:hypothetical protein
MGVDQLPCPIVTLPGNRDDDLRVAAGRLGVFNTTTISGHGLGRPLANGLRPSRKPDEMVRGSF